MSHRVFLFFSGGLGVAGVGLGAFGAHGLHERLIAVGMLSAWETAVLYHLVHTVAILAMALGDDKQSSAARQWLQRAGLCWITGVVLFSGSLYVMALGGPRWLGPVTPLGGLAFIIGWALLLPAAAKPRT
ncbi:MAG: DUF423 domain-containing protein [Opitutaceae bacterium]|nr:DUF423 domain-containing protein [Opitutaceae bacterium]